MTSVEAQERLANSLQLESLVISDVQKETSELMNVQKDQDNSIDASTKEDSKILIADTIDSIKDAERAAKYDEKKSENKHEVIILENDIKDECDSNEVDCVKNAGKSDTISSVLENGSKINKSDSAKETTIRSGTSLKRKQRNTVTQEADSLSEEHNPRSKRKKKSANDKFCWRCHKESVEAHCSACPRSWHRRCIGMPRAPIQNWICGDCAAILRAENAETRSTAMAQLSVDQLCLLLKHVVERMREYPGSEPFWKPVELSEAPNYLHYVVKPMDLSLLESNVRAKFYGSTDAFMADAKWIQHNCIVFNTCGGVYTDTSKLTNAAKQIIKLARQEVSEIEACPDCYAHGRNLPRPQPSWFIEPCRRPHPLVWAKLKGFPFWPAKAMPRINSQGFVDVRFFGEHDRAWVPPRDLYLYSEEPPVPLPRKRKLDMEECVREITRHCRKLELVFGQFKFAPPKVQYNPHDPTQIKLMLPNYDPLCSNGCASSQSLGPKKKPFVKKRLHVKAKSQSDSERADNSDNESKTFTDLDTSAEQSKLEEDSFNKQVNPQGDEPEDSSQTQLQLVSITRDARSDPPPKSNDESTAGERTSKGGTKSDKHLANAKLTKKEDAKPGTSKSTDANSTTESDTAKDDPVESNVQMLEQNNNSEKVVDDGKSTEKLRKQAATSLGKHSTVGDVQATAMLKNESSLLKINVNKGDAANPNLPSPLRSSSKSTKTAGKVYKPKTRMVDKVNAEKALRSIVNNQTQKSLKAEPTISVIQANPASMKDTLNNSNDSKAISSPSSMSGSKAQADIQDASTLKKPSTDQSVALFFVVNNGTSDSIKKPIDSLSAVEKVEKIEKTECAEKTEQEKEKGGGVPETQQTPGDTPHQKKESKARKSFPNKARPCPPLAVVSHPSASLLSNSADSMIYIPAQQTQNSTEYQMLPPEAGPISARLYHGAQDLAKKMAQLMEEAYKEVARENQISEYATSENHQATVHFLRLQIERMRWQHQQQIAELKHNTDRILREMKASLEAERLRAVEETRREVEEEKLRSIEQIKRKQWCAMCGREALFYCCWNTAYCDYPCQQAHWPLHMRTCAQKPSFTIVTSSAANSNQQQQVMPKLMINTQHASANVWRA